MMKQFEDYFSLQNLQGTEVDLNSKKPFGFSQNKRGNAAYFSLEEDLKFAAILEFKPETGKRGNHYHKSKKEYFYIIRGCIAVNVWFPEDKETLKSFVIKEGDLLIIKPGLSHNIEAIEESIVLEFSPNIFDIKDMFYES